MTMWKLGILLAVFNGAFVPARSLAEELVDPEKKTMCEYRFGGNEDCIDACKMACNRFSERDLFDCKIQLQLCLENGYSDQFCWDEDSACRRTAYENLAACKHSCYLDERF